MGSTSLIKVDAASTALPGSYIRYFRFRFAVYLHLKFYSVIYSNE